MDWIKKRYDQFLLALAAILLLACAVLLILRAQSFGEKFNDVQAAIPPNNKIPPLVLDRIEEAKATTEKPSAWVLDTNPDPQRVRGSLFVSEYYMIGSASGVPEKPKEGTLYTDSLTKQPIPNSWFMGNSLPLLNTDVATQDPDQDGFTNEDEWRGKTDPNNKDSHPPYHTKLFLNQFIKVPIRLIISSYDGDGKKDKPETMSYGINTVDLRQPSEFLKLGQPVTNTKFKLDKFEYKTKLNPGTGDEEDVSELTVINTETSEVVILVLTKVTDSPNTFALFDYQWPPTQDISVAKLQQFGLRPGTTADYKLIDINETEAVIQLPSGEKYTVPRDPRKAAK